MYTLSIETSGPYTSCAIAQDDQLKYFLASYKRFHHAEDINLLVDKLLKLEKIKWKDIQNVVITLGPGFFTGLRVGISFIKALSLVHQMKIYGVITLDVLAFVYGKEKVIPTLPAQKGEVFWAAYEKGKRISEYTISRMEKIKEKYPDFEVCDPVKYPDARELMEFFNQNKNALSPHNPLEIEPFYLRLPDAYLKHNPSE